MATGAAWALPVLAVGVTAPAYAVSPCEEPCPLNSTYGGAVNSNGWQLTTTGAFPSGSNQQVGYEANWSPQADGYVQCSSLLSNGPSVGSLSNVIIGQGDPTQANSTITYAKRFCLRPGRTYSLSAPWNAYGANPRGAFLQARLRSATGVVTNIGPQVSVPGRTPGQTTFNRQGTISGTFTVPTFGYYTFEYYWTFGTTPTSYADSCGITIDGRQNPRFANDIAVQAPTINCS